MRLLSEMIFPSANRRAWLGVRGCWGAEAAELSGFGIVSKKTTGAEAKS